jgi:DNA-binding MarR family transcriptional regulator
LNERDCGQGVGGLDAAGELKYLADDYVAVLVIAVANRLTRGASKYYREVWNLGVVEWRILICLGHKSRRAIGAIAEAADLDRGAVSRSVKLLGERGLITTQAGGRRVNLVSLTEAGKRLLEDLKAAGRRREQRLMAGFDANEAAKLKSLLRRLLAQVDFMNAKDEVAPHANADARS